MCSSGSDLHTSLDALRAEAAIRGKEWLQAELEGKDTDELRKLSSEEAPPKAPHQIWQSLCDDVEVKGQEWLQKELEGMDANELRTLCVTAEQLKLEAVQQGPNARAWLRRKLNTFSAKVAKDSVDGRSPLAALGAEVGVEDCLSKKALIERMIAVLLPEESLDSSAAVQRHAWRLLRSCLGRQAAGEQIDADFLSTEVFTQLADFGNGIKVNHFVTNDIQTRQYRSPEEYGRDVP
ncbi:unnamed protein product [Durusdinium trenchii]|uniref:Uncharacterized protein n=1 Tax=Durusdinium trenchii TaxID=1381693 RepID=A0ABP0IKU6_9DINO